MIAPATAVGISPHLSPFQPYRIPKKPLPRICLRVRNAWEDCQSSRDRNAIYGYLTAVFELVYVVGSRGSRHQPGTLGATTAASGFADYRRAVCGNYPLHRRSSKVDKRTRSKWSRRSGTPCNTKIIPSRSINLSNARAEINECASRFSRLLVQSVLRRRR